MLQHQCCQVLVPNTAPQSIWKPTVIDCLYQAILGKLLIRISAKPGKFTGRELNKGWDIQKLSLFKYRTSLVQVINHFLSCLNVGWGDQRFVFRSLLLMANAVEIQYNFSVTHSRYYARSLLSWVILYGLLNHSWTLISRIRSPWWQIYLFFHFKFEWGAYAM